MASAPLTALGAQKEIVALLKTIPNGAGGFLEVHEGATEDEELRQIVPATGTFIPIIVVNFTGFAKAPRRQSGITGARAATQEMSIIIQTIGNSDADARNSWGWVMDKVIGFVPTGCGELDSALYLASGKISFLGGPTRYTSTQSLVCYVYSDVC